MTLAQNGKFSRTSGSNNYTLSARNYDRNIFCFSVRYLLLVELNNELQLKKQQMEENGFTVNIKLQQ